MLKQLTFVAVGTLVAASAFAISPINPKAAIPATINTVTAEQSIALKDGMTLYVFKNGKMGMKDAYGKARHMEPGVVMETKDGEKVAMTSYDSWQLQSFLKPNGH